MPKEAWAKVGIAFTHEWSRQNAIFDDHFSPFYAILRILLFVGKLFFTLYDKFTIVLLLKAISSEGFGFSQFWMEKLINVWLLS